MSAPQREESDVTHRITRDHSCAEHEPCEGCVVGFWCDEHDGVRCEQWFAALQYAEDRRQPRNANDT